MSADLNYTLKRLVNGLNSDNHTVKRGFFLAMSQVLVRFKKQIDAMKLLKFITEETKSSKGMKNPEINALTLGKLMCLSAIVESQMYQLSSTQVNHDALNKVANDLLQMLKDHEFTRESIQQVLVKMLTNVEPLNAGAKILDRIVAEIFTVSEWKSFIFKHSDNLSIFLALRSVYL